MPSSQAAQAQTEERETRDESPGLRGQQDRTAETAPLINLYLGRTFSIAALDLGCIACIF